MKGMENVNSKKQPLMIVFATNLTQESLPLEDI
jgi:hypothetical protein